MDYPRYVGYARGPAYFPENTQTPQSEEYVETINSKVQGTGVFPMRMSKDEKVNDPSQSARASYWSSSEPTD